MDIFVIKMPDGNLMPASEHDREQLRAIKSMQPCRVKLTRVRNYEFHKKWFALVQYAYENWGGPIWETSNLPVSKRSYPRYADEKRKALSVEPHKDFDRFRKDITILAGYYDATYRLNGEVRLEAQSISFGAMSEDEFEKLYSATIEVIVKHVLTHLDGDSLRATLEVVEGFE